MFSRAKPHFSVVHTFRAAPHVVAAAMLDPELPGFLREHHELLAEASAEAHQEDGALVRRRVRYRPRPFLERLGPKKIPPEYLAYVEETTFDRDSLTGSFENRALRAAVRRHLINHGTVTLRATAEVKGVQAARDPALHDYLVAQFTSGAYGWMWPFPRVVRRWIERTLTEIERDGAT